MAVPGIDAAVEFSAQLCASLDRNTAILRAAEQRKQQMAADVSYPSPIAKQFKGSDMPVLWQGFGPALGWNWAVQRIVVAGLGTSDVVTAYRGVSTNDAKDQNALFSFTITTAATVAAWHPGRTALLLKGAEQASIVFGGSSSSTALTVSADVIQVSDAQLPYFLL